MIPVPVPIGPSENKSGGRKLSSAALKSQRQKSIISILAVVRMAQMQETVTHQTSTDYQVEQQEDRANSNRSFTEQRTVTIPIQRMFAKQSAATKKLA